MHRNPIAHSFAPAGHGRVNRFEAGNVDHEKERVAAGKFPLAFLRLRHGRRPFSVGPFYHVGLMPGRKMSRSITVTVE